MDKDFNINEIVEEQVTWDDLVILSHNNFVMRHLMNSHMQGNIGKSQLLMRMVNVLAKINKQQAKELLEKYVREPLSVVVSAKEKDNLVESLKKNTPTCE